MADYRSVKVEMWAQDEWFMELPIDAKLLWLYLFTNAHTSVAGIYKLPIRTICSETGIDQERVKSLLHGFAQDGKAKHSDGVVWVVKMRENQLPGKLSPKVKTRLDKDVASIPYCELKRRYLIAYGYPIDTVSIPTPTDTDTETELQTETVTPAASGSSGLNAQRAAVFQCWQDSIPGMLTATLAEMIDDDIETYGADEVIKAIGIAVSAGKTNLNYVEGILRRRAAGDEPKRNGTPPKKKQTVDILDRSGNVIGQQEIAV